MANFGNQLSNMMMQLLMQQFNAQNTDQTLLNQIGGYMINSALGNALYDASQKRMFKEYMPYAEAVKGRDKRLIEKDYGGLDITQRILKEMYPDMPEIPGLGDLSDYNRQSLNLLQDWAMGSPQENVGLANKYVRSDDWGKGFGGFIENYATPKDLAELELRAGELGAKKQESLDDVRSFVIRASDEAQKYIDYFSQGKAGGQDPDVAEAMKDVNAKIEKVFSKNKDLYQAILGDKERWFSKIGVSFFSELKEYIDKIAAKTLPTTAGRGGNLSPSEVNFITEAQNPMEMFRKFYDLDQAEYAKVQAFHEKISPKIDELLAFSSQPGTPHPLFGTVIEQGAGFTLPEANQKQLQELLYADRFYTGLPTVGPDGKPIPGDPWLTEEFHRMVWEMLIYGKSATTFGDTKQK